MLKLLCLLLLAISGGATRIFLQNEKPITFCPINVIANESYDQEKINGLSIGKQEVEINDNYFFVDHDCFDPKSGQFEYGRSNLIEVEKDATYSIRSGQRNMGYSKLYINKKK